MPVFTITVTAGEGSRVMNALCALAGTEPTQSNALDALKKMVVQVVKDFERGEAQKAAMAAVVVPTEIVPT